MPLHTHLMNRLVSITSVLSLLHLCRWEGIKAIRIRDGALGLSHFKLLKRFRVVVILVVYTLLNFAAATVILL
jgi:hypothetical protein